MAKDTTACALDEAEWNRWRTIRAAMRAREVDDSCGGDDVGSTILYGSIIAYRVALVNRRTRRFLVVLDRGAGLRRISGWNKDQ
jgi:hypothetical protein